MIYELIIKIKNIVFPSKFISIIIVSVCVWSGSKANLLLDGPRTSKWWFRLIFNLFNIFKGTILLLLVKITLFHVLVWQFIQRIFLEGQFACFCYVYCFLTHRLDSCFWICITCMRFLWFIKKSIEDNVVIILRDKAR